MSVNMLEVGSRGLEAEGEGGELIVLPQTSSETIL